MTPTPRHVVSGIVIGLALVVGAIAFALRNTLPDEPPPDASQPTEHAGNAPSPMAVVAPPRGAAPTPAPAAPTRVDPAAASAEPAALATPAPADERCPLVGTFVVTDQDGRVHDALDGEFVFVLFFRDGAQRVPARVAGGRFELTAPRTPRGFAVERARLGDRDVRCRERRAFRVGDSIALHGTWPPRFRLNVLDVRTGNHLDGVHVVASDAMRTKHPASRQPGDDARVVVTDAKSPIEFAGNGSSGPTLFHVRAAEHSWGSLVVDEDDTTERTIRLGQGGDLEVHVTGPVPKDARVAVHRVIEPPEGDAEPTIDVEQLAATTPLADLPLATDGPTRVRGLDPGTVAVRIVARSARRGPTHGFAVCRITSGSRSVAAITLQPVDAPPAVPFAGTVELSPSWPAPSHLVLYPTGAAALETESFLVPLVERKSDEPSTVHRFAWDAGDVPAGRYEILLDELAFSTTHTLAAPGDRELAIVVPDPAHVAIRVLDPTTGASVFATTHDVLLAVEAPRNGVSIPIEGVTGSDHVHRVAVAPGLLTVRATVDGERIGATSVTVRSGANEITLQPRPECGLVVVLKEGGTEIPFPNDLDLDLVDEKGASVLAYRLGNRIAATVPGNHTLLIGEVPGYLPRRDSGWVRAGEWFKLPVQLHRKR